jgi:hypothetical protein
LNVKASNFGPDGNFELFLEGLAIIKTCSQKNEDESCRRTLDLKIWFYSFLVQISSKEASELARIDPKFS